MVIATCGINNDKEGFKCLKICNVVILGTLTILLRYGQSVTLPSSWENDNIRIYIPTSFFVLTNTKIANNEINFTNMFLKTVFF